MTADWKSHAYGLLEERDFFEKKRAEFFVDFQKSAKRVYQLESQLAIIQKTDLQVELADKLTKIQQLTTENEKLVVQQQQEIDKSQAALQKSATLEKNLQILRDSYSALDRKFKLLKEESFHKAQNLESINDQILSLQIENNLLSSQNQELRAENDKLIQRWLDKVQKDAESLNEIIRINESSKEQKS